MLHIKQNSYVGVECRSVGMAGHDLDKTYRIAMINSSCDMLGCSCSRMEHKVNAEVDDKAKFQDKNQARMS